ncbi:ATP-binding protein [Yinghuangia aomiensis]|uniref:ATP-binding protein n=1 Tax=Yinghuangia aomiensis TaxID=676205 RepID=UPI0031EBA587
MTTGRIRATGTPRCSTGSGGRAGQREAIGRPAAAVIDATFDFTYAPHAARIADGRREVEQICREHGFDHLDPVLVASELLTNAVKFGTPFGRRIGLTVRVNASCLIVEVSDPDVLTVPDLDNLTEAGEDVETGRGLLLTRAVADHVEVHLDSRRGRKAVSARFDRTSK